MSYIKLTKLVEIIFEDEDILVVSKPTGLFSVPDRSGDTSNLKDFLLKSHQEIYTVHRLDKETSGIMVFAKNEKAQKHLSKQFNTNAVINLYWAFVQNKPEIESGIIDVPILNDMRRKGRMFVSKEGSEAITKYKVLKNFGTISLMSFHPITERTHQIRVHSTYLGCPLLVDKIYSKKENFFLSSIKRGYKNAQFENERPFIKRLTLHAKSLEFEMVNGEKKCFEDNLPKDLKALYNQLEKNT